MSLIPDSPQYSEEGASVTNPSLETGLDALKQGDYKQAIAHLEGVLGLDQSQNTVLQAQMGLVVAYERAGEPEKAIALCQTLTQSGQTKVEAWASNTLANFAKRYPHLLTTPYSSQQTPDFSLSTSDATGFVPLEEIPSSPADITGFVSFDQTPPQQSSHITVSRTPMKPSPHSQGDEPDVPLRRSRGGVTPPLDVSLFMEHGNEPSTINNEQVTGGDSSTQTKHEAHASEAGNRIPSTIDIEWCQAGRAQEWRPLKPIKLGRLLFVQVVTAIALFWVIHLGVQFAMATTNNILLKLPFGQAIPAFYSDPTPALGILLAILLCASPWLLDGLLKLFYGLQPLPLTQLASQSPESARVVQRYCRQRRLPLPTLGILPTSAPVALTYGNLPRTARIVVSQGLLEQLTDDEIATIYASELGHIVNWDFVFMSLIVLVVQLPYTVYWLVAQWGDRLKSESEEAKVQSKKFYFFLFNFTFFLAGVIAAISYGVYLLFRWPALWFSRARIFYSDRLAAEITGNPNGFTRALLKIAIGIAKDTQNYRATSWLLEGFDLLMPLGHQQAINLGSYRHFTSSESLLRWDCTNSYRHWLVITHAHPLTGERLRILGRFAQFWHLETELNLEAFTQPSSKAASGVANLIRLLLHNHRGLPLLQSAILSGLVLGLVLKSFLWLIGWIGNQINFWPLIWLYQDRNGALLMGSLLIGFSISIFIHINAYFPDITSANVQTEPSLPDLYTLPTAQPSDIQPVRLTGKLIGRRGISNWLAQDLILHSPTGLVKLNFLSQLGPIGNFWPLPTHPSSLLDRQVTATGWFRRGASPWIDIETLSIQSGKTCRAGYPVWLTILACVSAVWGAYIIWQSA